MPLDDFGDLTVNFESSPDRFHLGNEGVMRENPLERAMTVRRDLEEKLQEIPGVTRRPSRWGHRHAYFTGEREIAHFHGDQRLDVRLTRAWIRERKSEGAFDERVTTRGPSAEWVAVRVIDARDVAFAASLVQEAVQVNG
jgi:Family of unknown function (DUF5519)